MNSVDLSSLGERSAAANIRLISALCAALISATVLFGWTRGIVSLTQIIPGLSAMNPMTATSVLVASVGLALHSRLKPKTTRLSGALVGTVGAIKISQVVLGIAHGIDQLSVASKLTMAAGIPPNRMAPNTALALLLIGLALAFSPSKSKNAVLLSQILSIVVFSIALFALIGYLLGIVALYEVHWFNAMALHSAVALMVLSVGILSANPRLGLMRVVTDHGPAGQIARLAMPLAVIVPVGVGILQLTGEKLGYLSIEGGNAFEILANILVTVGFLMSGVIVLHRSDIERQRNEIALERSEREFRLAESIGNVGHWRLNLSDRQLTYSDQFLLICGYPVGSTPSLETLKLFQPPAALITEGCEVSDLTPSRSWDVKRKISHPDGQVRYIRSIGLSETDCNGTVISLFGVFVDETELELSRQMAEAGEQAKATFLANMSHEIRTPLNSIIGFTDLMLDSPTLPSEFRGQVRLVKSSGDALLVIINDILDFSKLEAGKLELSPHPFDMDSLVYNTIAIIRQSAEVKGLSVSYWLDRALGPRFVGDDARLRQILLNLLSNAIKFTSTGSVSLSVEKVLSTGDLERIRFSVVDTGVGVPLGREAHLFKHFSQADASISRNFGGTGLGLAICKSVVTLMDGTIGYSPIDSGGSKFWFEIELESTESVPRYRDAQTAAIASPLRRLLAEDLAVNQELATAILTRAGHVVDLANNGREAVAAVQRNDYDLILMDIQMPIMDGISAAKLIRLLPGRGAVIPIIALTANVLPKQIEAFLQAGMDGHVAKPIRVSELNAAMARHVRTLQTDRKEDVIASGYASDEFDDCTYRLLSMVIHPEKLERHLAALSIALSRLIDPGLSPIHLRNCAHEIVGQAGIFGFFQLSLLCRQLDTAIAEGQCTDNLRAKITNSVATVTPKIEILSNELGNAGVTGSNNVPIESPYRLNLG